MAAPVVVGTPTNFQSAVVTTTVTLAKPTTGVTVQNGDVLVAIIRSQSSTTTADYVASGFTRAGATFVASQGTARAMGTYYKIVTNAGSEPASYDFVRTDTASSGSRQAGAMFVLRGVDTAAPIAGFAPDYVGTAITNGKRIESFTVSSDAIMVSTFAAEMTSGVTTVPNTPPTGYTLTATAATTGDTTVTRTAILAYTKAITAGEAVQAAWTTNPSGIGAQGVAFKGTGTITPITYVLPQNTSIGHRGASLDAPEMSMAAYAVATARGLNSLEISVARTSDNVFFGLHDESLDRTSLGTGGGTGTTLVASTMTWAQVQGYTILPPAGSVSPAQPYVTLKEMFDTYASSRIIFVDPKVIPTSGYAALLDLMDSYPDSKNHFIAKGFCDTTAWAVAAKARGYQTWGYFYTADVDAGKIATRAGSWDMLGLEYSATQANWDLIRNVDNGAGGKKPVIGHIINNAAAQTTAYSKGAYATMVSAVKANFAVSNKQAWEQVFAGEASVTAVYVGTTRIWP